MRKFAREFEVEGDDQSESAKDFSIGCHFARLGFEADVVYVAIRASRAWHVGDVKCFDRDDYFRRTALMAFSEANPINEARRDFADLIGAEGSDGKDETSEETGEQKPLLFPAIPIDEFVRQAPAQPIVDGLIYHVGPQMAYSKPGTGKSRLFFSLCAAMAHRLDQWLGRKLYLHGPALYVAAEGQVALVTAGRAWSQHHGVELDGQRFQILPCGGQLDLTDEAHHGELLRTVEAVGAVFVVIDTLSASTPGANENATEDMSRVIQFGLRLYSQLGVYYLARTRGVQQCSRREPVPSAFTLSALP